jgi:hypothetical protein
MSTTAIHPAYVGRYIDQGKIIPLPLSDRDLKRQEEHVKAVLDTFDFKKQRYGLLISLMSQGVTFLPFELALMRQGMICCNCDDSPYEAGRIESILRRFDPAFTAGVTAQVLDGIKAAGFDQDKLFADSMVWAKPDAYERLKSVPGIRLLRWLELGPALALECRFHHGAHISDREWKVEEENGELLITSRLDRATPITRLKTGIRGTVTYEPCPCGHPGARIIVG